MCYVVYSMQLGGSRTKRQTRREAGTQSKRSHGDGSATEPTRTIPFANLCPSVAEGTRKRMVFLLEKILYIDRV